MKKITHTIPLIYDKSDNSTWHLTKGLVHNLQSDCTTKHLAALTDIGDTSAAAANSVSLDPPWRSFVMLLGRAVSSVITPSCGVIFCLVDDTGVLFCHPNLTYLKIDMSIVHNLNLGHSEKRGNQGKISVLQTGYRRGCATNTFVVF